MYRQLGQICSGGVSEQRNWDISHTSLPGDFALYVIQELQRGTLELWKCAQLQKYMNSSNSRRHKWVSVGVGVPPQSQDLVADSVTALYFDRKCTLRQYCSVMAGSCVLWQVSALNVLFRERFIFRKSLFMSHLYHLRGGGLCREAVPWCSDLSLVMRDAEFDAEWSWLSGSVKSSDCAQDFWRDEGSGMNVHVLPMCPKWVKVASSPWEEWGNRLSSSHGSCWHGDVGKMGSLMHAGISFNILVLLLFCLDL